MTDKQPPPTLIQLCQILQGERITVRPYCEADAQELYEAVASSRDHLRPWMPFADEHQSPAESLDWIMHSMASWLLRETLNLGIWHTETGHYLGGIGIHPHNWAARSFEIGYWLRVSAAGQGYITEAAGLVVAYLFDQLEAKRVQICCDERNLRSAAVARRLGFIQEGRLRNDQLTPTGTLRTTLIFGMIPADRSR